MIQRQIVGAIVAAICLTAIPAAAHARSYIGVKYKLQENSRGFLILEVLPDSPAAKAGLKADDVILKIDGTEPTSLKEFREIFGLHKVGDTVTLEIQRDNKEKKVKVTLGELKD
jgi:S1-C subfamily serine protease